MRTEDLPCAPQIPPARVKNLGAHIFVQEVLGAHIFVQEVLGAHVKQTKMKFCLSVFQVL